MWAWLTHGGGGAGDEERGWLESQQTDGFRTEFNDYLARNWEGKMYSIAHIFRQAMKRTSKALALGFSAVLCSYFTSTRAYADNIFVANGNGNSIEEFDSAGSEVAFSSTDLSSPSALAFDSSGNLYVADASTDTICKI